MDCSVLTLNMLTLLDGGLLDLLKDVRMYVMSRQNTLCFELHWYVVVTHSAVTWPMDADQPIHFSQMG